MCPATQREQSLSSGSPSGPGSQRQRENLSTSSPVWEPKRTASSRSSREGKWTSRLVAAAATRVVWLRLDIHTMSSGGSMLHWARKPIRQPARSVPSLVVTTTMG